MSLLAIGGNGVDIDNNEGGRGVVPEDNVNPPSGSFNFFGFLGLLIPCFNIGVPDGPEVPPVKK